MFWSSPVNMRCSHCTATESNWKTGKLFLSSTWIFMWYPSSITIFYKSTKKFFFYQKDNYWCKLDNQKKRKRNLLLLQYCLEHLLYYFICSSPYTQSCNAKLCIKDLHDAAGAACLIFTVYIVGSLLKSTRQTFPVFWPGNPSQKQKKLCIFRPRNISVASCTCYKWNDISWQEYCCL